MADLPLAIESYITLPGTDLNISRLAIGTWLFGGLRWGEVDERESEKTFLSAIDSGINFIDTADAYGKGKSEEFVARLTKDRKDNLVIATKVGVVWNPDGTRRIDLSKNYILSAAEKSLSRLNLDKIDLYFLHEPDPNTPIDETIEALQILKSQGKIRYIGLSNFTAPLIESFHKKIELCCLQDELNLIQREAETGNLKLAFESGLGFLAYGALSKGLLSGKFKKDSQFSKDDNRSGNDHFSGDRFEKNLDRVSLLHEIAMDLGVSTSALSIAWILKLKQLTSVILGARTQVQLSDQISSLEINLTEDMHSRISEIFK
ncbi:aldo/keto reductase [Leptospira idonii]|uniref:Aldo/keto reductase n=1 Tax=Leptospira idonii TaxID=1193500 RepID=A0A4R9LVN8_9LEPT|nr:aldo/keto reductase [Leptospira idonii]TGN18260.1 aldo/keto reductase [Leptospira idonii]